VEKVTLVDLDPEMTRLFATHPLLTRLNDHSLTSPKVHVINADAFVWLNENTDVFDFVVVDFPDPNNYSVGKLYTSAFYRALERHVSRGGLFVVQSTSPLFARQSFWSIVETLKRTGLKTYPYHVYVPSFGEWGFTLASATDSRAYAPPAMLPSRLRFLAAPDIAQLFSFPRDMQPVPAEPNRLNDQALVRYYEKEFEAINR
jgi:spermidine synthase